MTSLVTTTRSRLGASTSGRVGAASFNWATGARSWRGTSRWWQLAAVCVGANMAELGLVTMSHGTGAELMPQASAVPPFGVFSDLRWVSVYNNSWPTFAAEVAAMLLVRTALTAISVLLAWPSHLPSPSGRALLGRSGLATALSAALVYPSVVLLFASAVAPVSWLFLTAVPLSVLVALVVHPIGMSADWWRRPLSLRALGWVVLVFATMSLAGALVATLPEWLWPLVAVASGFSNAWSWRGLVGAVVERRPSHLIVPVVPLAVLALVGGVIGGTVTGFHDARQAAAEDKPAAAAAPNTGGQPVLFVSGYGSSWDGQVQDRLPGDFAEEQFSYRGLSPTGEPLAYSGADTVKPVPELDQMLLAQLKSFYEKTGKKVDLVAESEGAVIAKTALLAQPGAPVAALVMASPLEAPGRVSYPTSGDRGWGAATDAAMHLVSKALGAVSTVALSPTSAFIASLDTEGPLLERAMSCPVAGVQQFLLLPLADATVVPPKEGLPFPSAVVPAFHGGLLEDPSTDKVISQVLSGGPLERDVPLHLAEQAISYAAGAWQVPSLVTSQYPPGVLGVGSTPSCAKVVAKLHDVDR